MPDTAFEITNPELLKRVEGISNGTIKDIVISGQTQEIAATVTDTLSGGELAPIVEGTYEIPINDGTVNFMHYEGTGFVDAPVTSTTAIQKTVPAGPITQYNSNVTTIQRGRVVQPYNASVSNGKINLSATPKLGSFAANAAYFLGEVNQAATAASVGIMLGKFIDSTLYNINPEFWDANGMSSINPETWGSITHGDDSLGAKLFNMVFGIDPETKNAQAYLSEEAFAYLAYYMQTMGVFPTTQEYQAKANDNTSINPSTVQPISYSLAIGSTCSYTQGDYTYYNQCNVIETTNAGDTVYAIHTLNTPYYNSGSPYYNFWYLVSRSQVIKIGFHERRINNRTGAISESDRTYTRSITTADRVSLSDGTYAYSASESYFLYSGAYYGQFITSIPTNDSAGMDLRSSQQPTYRHDIAELIFLGDNSKISGVEGITDQTGATLPDTSNWSNVPTTLANLPQQYPDIWDDAIKYDQLQPDGTLKEQTYVPVGWPSLLGNPWTNVQPTTGANTSTQTKPYINLDDYSDPNPTPLTQTLTQTPTPTVDPTTTIPQNPSDTGNGSTGTPVPPTGSASALWSVYHPTQTQVNNFGAWLWSGDIITQIQQILNNPMDGIISLHKIYATPIDSGSGTIVVGRLDSNVPSATVEQQYVTVDCGTITVDEQFGNIFDYNPYTETTLYLPFIGFVPIDTNDVMRSTIHVTYGVDIFTGACLAMIEITRDGNTINMYQYSGMCSVEYPLTGGQHSGLISGLLGVAGGIAGIALASTGAGIATGLGAIASGTATASKTNVGRSGGFSGNAGAMGIKKPYLVLVRPQTKVADNFDNITGYPTNYTATINQCSGKVVIRDVRISGINATDNELDQIRALLLSGIIV